MGDIVPFIARVRDTGDWSPAERERLEAFADRLAASGVKIEIIFGTTDEGDPWCVVKDQNEDILVHVARIGGRFVVYSAIDDTIAEDANLHEALRDRLAGAVEIPTAQVLPFLSREAQTFIALIVATAFFYETTGLDVSFAPPAAPLELQPEPEPPLAPATADEAHVQDRDVAIQGAVFAETVASDLISRQLVAMMDEPADVPLPPPASAKDQPQVLPIETAARQTSAAMLSRSEAVDPGERLSGQASGERMVGGAGDDTLRGSALDTLQGGAGDDRLELAGATATGGEGADTFVILNPTVYGNANTLLGVITDFSAAEGDRVTDEVGVQISLRPPTLAPTPGGGDRTTEKTSRPEDDGYTRVEVDLNGDGVMDGYILVRTRSGSPDETDKPPPKPEHEDFEQMAITGGTLSGAEDPWAA